jgi:hypothetical protein
MSTIRELSDKALIAEWAKWDGKIRAAKSWGASLTAAAEFRADCEREMRLRKLIVGTPVRAPKGLSP